MLIFVFMKILAMKVESFDASESFDGPSSSIAHKTKHQPPKYDETTHPSITPVENSCLLLNQDKM